MNRSGYSFGRVVFNTLWRYGAIGYVENFEHENEREVFADSLSYQSEDLDFTKEDYVVRSCIVEVINHGNDIGRIENVGRPVLGGEKRRLRARR